MSLLSALYTGTTGLQANSEELSVVGDNIANANTVGFKGARAAFEEALSQNLGGNVGQIGTGTRLQTVQRIMRQGALLNTGVNTDLALQGEGFFIVKGSYAGEQGQFYSRAGQFTVDRDGYLTTTTGMRIQGYQADLNGTVTGRMGDMLVGSATVPPTATGEVTVRANLQADAAIPAAAWDPTDPNGTSNFSTSIAVYDSLGNAHAMDIYYTRTGPGTWDFHAVVDGGSVQGGVPGQLTEVATGSLTFDSNGRLVDVVQSSNFNPVDATAPQTLNFNFGDALNAGGTGLGGVTQFATPSATSFINQDGSSAGELSHIDVDGNGNVVGSFTNGETRVLGRIAVATFPAADKLRSMGGTLYGVTPESGPPTTGTPGEGGRASIVAGALEQSNVDLAAEFVRMIAAQRGFQANSKTLTTADQLLSELIALKR